MLLKVLFRFLGHGKGADFIPGFQAGGGGGGHGGRGGRAAGRILSAKSYGSVLKPLEFGKACSLTL